MIKFLPSYVGSKSYWVNYLEKYKDKDFVELFAGSAVLSANLAKSCILNDKDKYVYKILSEFDKLIVPESFTQEDYFRVRSLSDWWKYSYNLQKMSFSGVFRYSKNGYNVPVKKYITEVNLLQDYQEALNRWKNLNPVIFNKNYLDIEFELLENKVVVFDPPYENSQASYNYDIFDYHQYFEYIRLLEGSATILLFDNIDNLPFNNYKSRAMVVNGKHKKNSEGLFEFNRSLKSGHEGEMLFSQLNPNLKRTDGFEYDFITSDNKTIELKSDYYSMNKTPNYFMEIFSVLEKDKLGGPFQSLQKGVDYYIYFFVKEKIWKIFDVKSLCERIKKVASQGRKVKVPNKGYTTFGLTLHRELFKDLEIEIIL